MDEATKRVVWMWRDESSWKEYDEATCAILESAYHLGQKRITLSHGWFYGKGYIVHTIKMIQFNPKTDGYRHVQRIDPGLPITWSWKSDEGWKPYDTITSNQIEHAFQRNLRSLTLSEGYFKGTNNFQISLKNSIFIQTNTQTGVIRQIRRYHGHAGALMSQHGGMEVHQESAVFGAHHKNTSTLGKTGWVWQKGNDWKVFDAEAEIEIETAWHQSKPWVLLTTGVFGSRPGVYLVDFHWMVQVNLESKMLRTVKRIGPGLNDKPMNPAFSVPVNKNTYTPPPGIQWKKSQAHPLAEKQVTATVTPHRPDKPLPPTSPRAHNQTGDLDTSPRSLSGGVKPLPPRPIKAPSTFQPTCVVSPPGVGQASLDAMEAAKAIQKRNQAVLAAFDDEGDLNSAFGDLTFSRPEEV